MRAEIHPTAIVDDEARIGDDVTVGPWTMIGPGVDVGDRTRIGSHCLLGHVEPGNPVAALRIGPDSVVRSHCVLYGGSTIGPRLETGHHVTIREGMMIGENLRVGTLSDLQGHAEVGDYVRFHSNVHVGHGAVVHDFVWIFPYVVLTNDPHPPSDGYLQGVTVERFAVLATRATVLPGLTIGTDAFVAAGATVTRDVRVGALVAGAPAKDRGDASRIRLTGTDRPAYPWRHHFRRGYPAEVVSSWDHDPPGTNPTNSS